MVRHILLTGAAGKIGQVLARMMPQAGEIWRLTDLTLEGMPEGEPFERMAGDLTDPGFVSEICSDVDAIIHMAGQSHEKGWEELIGPNIQGTANLWQAAADQRVDRFIFGSTNHVLGMYPVGQRLDLSSPMRPDSRYGASKLFGEALAQLYADKSGVRGFVIRIGAFLERPTLQRHLIMWISHRDMCALVRLGLEADYHCETVFGISDNRRACYDNRRAYALGYCPQDDAEIYAGDVTEEAAEPDSPGYRLQGGSTCGREFLGNLAYLVDGKGIVGR
ncbi:NAD(P)-dependent oxidoreductase [uncultured Cohaesibacter sp.]|uniref:NAD-dependent epimerase/dehydratase family protein n=1 Tax=uncultured Cohaesibacter sp. TaxID=1002546 RepID=UPI0029C8953A|nr:NAD(P)-dependent oxidoreductase [uncultured Cohaesibacter sp.]